MTQEEKARAYDEALGRARGINNEHKAQPFDVMLKVFPELKENEDEKIRKVLLNDFKNNCSEYYCEGVNRDMIIAWLEKQGQQKDPAVEFKEKESCEKVTSFTSFPQSKKLANILPPETADMYWDYDAQKHEHYPMVIDDQFDDTCVRAWSLSALFGALPNFIGDYGKCLYYDVGGYYCGYMVDGDFMLTIEETKADNPIDACYEFILKLHELNLL